MDNEVLLTLSIRPAQADALTDWLLQQDLPGFTSWQGWGHGNRHHGLSLAEQIQGKQKRTLIGLHLPQSQAHQLLALLKQTFCHYDLHYWLQPLLAFGHLGKTD